MRYTRRVLFLVSLVVCFAVGCSENSTAPDNNSPPSAGKHLWSKSFGDAGYELNYGVAVDALGNVIITGQFDGTVSFGGDTFTNAGGSDIYVAKFGSDGAHLWSKSFGDAEYQHAHAIAVDALGNVVVAGLFEGAVDFGGGALLSAGGYDAFIAKFGSDGTYLWSKSFGDVGFQHAQAVAVDALENVVVTGLFDGTADFGGGELTSASGNDIFVAKFGSDGAHLWSMSFGDAGDQAARAVAVDALGNMVVMGQFDGTVNFGGGALTSAGSNDVFVAKFGSDGTHLWSKNFGDGDTQWATAVAVDGSGNVVITGYFGGTVDFGGGALTSASGNDIFVAKFGSDGAHLWSMSFGDAGDQAARAVAVDASGTVTVTGLFEGAVDFGGGALTSAGGYDIFVAQFGSDGTHLWSKSFGDGDTQRATAVAVDALGNVVVTGHFDGTVDFGGGALTSAGSTDIFVAKFGR